MQKITWEKLSTMRWITNQPMNPSEEYLKRLTFEVREAYFKWRSQFTIGRPKAIPSMSVEQLEKEGFIGLYDPNLKSKVE